MRVYLLSNAFFDMSQRREDALAPPGGGGNKKPVERHKQRGSRYSRLREYTESRERARDIKGGQEANGPSLKRPQDLLVPRGKQAQMSNLPGKNVSVHPFNSFEKRSRGGV